MYFEASGLTVNQKARLQLVPAKGLVNQKCLTFYYHMYGLEMGTLNVYQATKTENIIIDQVLKFTLSGKCTCHICL